MSKITLTIIGMLAGWFSAVIGFEVSHNAGNIALVISVLIMAILIHKND